MTYVGIDVCKAIFVVAYPSSKTSKIKMFKNIVKDVHEFIQVSLIHLKNITKREFYDWSHVIILILS